jgi:hypothetical protein
VWRFGKGTTKVAVEEVEEVLLGTGVVKKKKHRYAVVFILNLSPMERELCKRQNNNN